jgi:hypothetical protein
MSQREAEEFLGTDAKHVRSLIKARRLKRDKLTGAFLRAQVIELHDEIVRGLYNADEDDASAMGSDKSKMGVLDGFRQEPNLV